MKITNVKIRKVNKEGKMKAVVSVTFDDMFVVHDMKVIEKDDGLFIAMPSRKTSDGEFRDIAHPINQSSREMVQAAVFEEHYRVINEEEQALNEEETAAE